VLKILACTIRDLAFKELYVSIPDAGQAGAKQVLRAAAKENNITDLGKVILIVLATEHIGNIYIIYR
jgi:hypothetical protein